MMRMAFYKSNRGTFLDFMIDAWTGFGGFSHCELVFSDGMSFSSSPREGKCRFKSIKYDDKWVMVDLDWIGDLNEGEIRLQCINEVGKKYDYLGIFFTFVLPIHVDDRKKWWCSEICTKMIGIKKFRISPNRLFKVLMNV